MKSKFGSKLTAGCLGVLLVGSISACGADGASDTDGGVKIGLVLPMSGSLAQVGAEQEAGFNFVIDQINKSGGIESLGGAKIEVELADDASDPRKTADESRRLITREGVVAVAGLAATPMVTAAAPVMEQYEVMGLSTTAGIAPGDTIYSLGYEYDRGFAQNPVEFLKWLDESENLGLERVALAFENNEAGQGVSKIMAELVRDAGYELVASEPIDPEATDLTPVILRLRAKQPDVVLSTLYNATGIRFHTARAAQNYNDPVWIGEFGGWTEHSVWDTLGQRAAETLGGGDFGLGYMSPDLKIDALQALISEAEDADLGVSVSAGHFVMGAQAARIVQAALEEAGGSGDEVTAEAIVEAMPSVQLKQGDSGVYLPRSELKFAEDRLIEDQSGVFTQWNEDGTQDSVWPEQYAARKPNL